MKNLLTNLHIFFVFIALIIPLYAQDNLALIDSLTREIAFEEFSSLTDPAVNSVLIDASALDKTNSVYLNLLLGNALSEKSFTVYRNSDPFSAFEGTTFKISEFNVVLVYSKPYTKSFIGKTFLKRKLVVQLFGQLFESKSGRIIKPVKGEKSFDDEILYDELENIEKSPYPFTQGILSDISNWQIYFEPLVALSSIAVLIYLFFSLRT